MKKLHDDWQMEIGTSSQQKALVMARDPYLQASDAEDGESGFDEDL